MSIELLTDDNIALAAKLLDSGDIVALPTETVYGLAADSYNEKAIAKIFAVKGRPLFNPLISHVADLEMANKFAIFCNKAEKLAQKFWPGPLTLVLPVRDDTKISSLARAGLPSVAIRNPHGVIAKLSNMLERPLVAPSANRSGFLSPTTAQAVYEDLGSKIPLIIDGGACKVGVESTVIKINEEGEAFLLRAGGLAVEDIEDCLQQKLKAITVQKAIEAPGMLVSHYSPNKAIRINATSVNEGELLLAFGKSRISGFEKAAYCLNLSPSGDLVEAASNLFDYLHKLDNLKGDKVIAVEPISNEGLGQAINDRLQRAAAPKD